MPSRDVGANGVRSRSMGDYFLALGFQSLTVGASVVLWEGGRWPRAQARRLWDPLQAAAKCKKPLGPQHPQHWVLCRLRGHRRPKYSAAPVDTESLPLVNI